MVGALSIDPIINTKLHRPPVDGDPHLKPDACHLNP
jgi:hypothetical protein